MSYELYNCCVQNNSYNTKAERQALSQHGWYTRTMKCIAHSQPFIFANKKNRLVFCRSAFLTTTPWSHFECVYYYFRCRDETGLHSKYEAQNKKQDGDDRSSTYLTPRVFSLVTTINRLNMHHPIRDLV